jgi:hypothetical protein
MSLSLLQQALAQQHSPHITYLLCWYLVKRSSVKKILLGAFVKLRKATISFDMSVRLSVRQHATTRHPLNGFS